MKPENFLFKIRAAALDSAKDREEMELLLSLSEIASVAINYLEEKKGESNG